MNDLISSNSCAPISQSKIKNFSIFRQARSVIFVLFTLFCSSSLMAYEHNLAVCAIFKDCSPYLKEWIEYHRLIGVDHFYLFNNSSTDHPRRVLKSYIDKGIVTLIKWPNRNEDHWGSQIMAWVGTTQLPAYEFGCKLAKKKAKWLAFIDSDEFIVPMTHSTLTHLLKSHEEAPGICLNWVIYGTSDIYDIPENHLMIEMLNMRAPLDHPINIHTKSIVKPEEFAGWSWAPHACLYKNGASAYCAPPEEARINHYINRTVRYFYEHKIKNKETADNVKWSDEYIEECLHLGNDEEDLTMQRFVPKLRKKMGFN